MRKGKWLIAVLLLAIILAAPRGFQEKTVSGYLRLHIKANSNFPADQELKNAVRETVLDTLAGELQAAVSAKDAAKTAKRLLPEVVWRAERTVRQAGFAYPVNARLGYADFPTCYYGDSVLQAGRYLALTVELGKGRGQNWWCVLFPPLCFVGLSDDKDLPAVSEPAFGLEPRSRLLEWWGRRTMCREVGVAKKTGFLYNYNKSVTVQE